MGVAQMGLGYPRSHSRDSTPESQRKRFRKRLANDQIDGMKKLALCVWDIAGDVQEIRFN